MPTSGAAIPQGFCDLFNLLALELRRQQVGPHGVEGSDDSEKKVRVQFTLEQATKAQEGE